MGLRTESLQMDEYADLFWGEECTTAGSYLLGLLADTERWLRTYLLATSNASDRNISLGKFRSMRALVQGRSAGYSTLLGGLFHRLC